LIKVKKTKRASGSSKSSAKGTKSSKKESPRKAGRIPVRGARKASGPGSSGKSSPGGSVRGTSGKSSPGSSVRGTSGKSRSGLTLREAAASRAARPDLDEIRTLAVAAIDAALDKKALAPVLIDVSGMASYTDFIGIVSGRSDRQVDAIAENVRQVMKAHGRQTLGQEGTGGGRWSLLDFGSVVIHVFYHPVREFYDLESLWIEAPRVPLNVPADAVVSQPDAYYGAL
jgi:ribosome-associated protein